MAVWGGLWWHSHSWLCSPSIHHAPHSQEWLCHPLCALSLLRPRIVAKPESTVLALVLCIFDVQFWREIRANSSRLGNRSQILQQGNSRRARGISRFHLPQVAMLD